MPNEVPQEHNTMVAFHTMNRNRTIKNACRPYSRRTHCNVAREEQLRVSLQWYHSSSRANRANEFGPTCHHQLLLGKTLSNLLEGNEHPTILLRDVTATHNIIMPAMPGCRSYHRLAMRVECTVSAASQGCGERGWDDAKGMDTHGVERVAHVDRVLVVPLQLVKR